MFPSSSRKISGDNAFDGVTIKVKFKEELLPRSLVRIRAIRLYRDKAIGRYNAYADGVVFVWRKAQRVLLSPHKQK